jgi:hypothetical protein
MAQRVLCVRSKEEEQTEEAGSVEVWHIGLNNCAVLVSVDRKLDLRWTRRVIVSSRVRVNQYKGRGRGANASMQG